MQLTWSAAAAGLLVGAGMLLRPLHGLSEEYDLAPPGNVAAESSPETALLTVALGGLRAPIVNFCSILSEAHKQAGRYHDAMQLADLPCRLQPRFPGVWDYHAWNMAWNMSVAHNTPEERWLWVSNGIRLLRDRGIPLNPKALVLYKSLGWIFFSKMGQTADDMHVVYKQRWASQMQRLLGAPPYGEITAVIDAFRPIAEAPLDKDARRSGKTTIQDDQRQIVLRDPAVAGYARMLAAHGVAVDESLLRAYNRFSHDETVEIPRDGPPTLKTDRDRALAGLINSAEHADARGKLLAFVRAQVLWNDYKMDPAWMLHIMKKYNVPLDWRLVQPHGLYWVTYGVDICKTAARDDIDTLSTYRIVLNCMKAMTWNGRLTYRENPDDPDSPQIAWLSDWRYIEPTHRVHLELIEALLTARREKLIDPEDKSFDENTFREGHINFLMKAIQMLYAGYRWDEAKQRLDWIKKNYSPSGNIWELDGLREFVIETLNMDGTPVPDLVRSQLHGSLIAAVEQLAANRPDAYRELFGYAKMIYDIYQENANERIKLPPFPVVMRNAMAVMLTRPQTQGAYLDLPTRGAIYRRLHTQMQLMLYDGIAPLLRRQCAAARPVIDFDEDFPPPPGLEAARARRRDRMTPAQP